MKRGCLHNLLSVVAVLLITCLTLAIPVSAASTYDSGNGTVTANDYSLAYSWVTTYDKANASQSGDNNGGSGSVTLSGNVFTLKAKSSYYRAASLVNWTQDIVYNYSTQLTLTNNGAYGCKITYNTSGSMGTVTGATVELAKGASTVFALTTTTSSTSTSAQNLTGTVTITEIEVYDKVNVTFAPFEKGTYTYTIGETSTTVAPNAESTTLELTSATAVTLTAGEAVSGYSFYGWMASGELLSTESTYVYPVTVVTEIYPAFISNELKNAGAPYQVGNNLHMFWHLAFADAQATGQAVAIARNYTMPTTLADNGLRAGHVYSYCISGNASSVQYIVPKGTSLLIPFDDANTLYTTAPGTVTVPQGTASISVSTYRTLKMAPGANIIVNGAMSVSGKQCASMEAGFNGAPIEAHGAVDMASGSSITVNSGANLYVWGFITGSGSVLVKSGATVYEDFQIRDFRGGTATSGMLKNSQKVFPLSQYYIQNVEVPMTLEAGAKENVSTAMDITLVGIQQTLATLIGQSDGMFRLTSGTLTKDYDEENDRLVFTVKGNINIASINIELKLGIGDIMGASSINSKDYVLPLNNNYTINADSGELAISQDFAMLPGAQLNIAKDAKVALGSGVNLYVYDAAEWGGYTGAGNNTFKPVANASSCTMLAPKRTSLSDAKITVAGTLDVGAGALYTTSSGAVITGEDGGSITLTPGSATVTYQGVQGGSDGKTMSFTEIPITPAKLQHGNETYLESAKSTTKPNTYTYTNGKWICATHTDEDTNHNCDVCGFVTECVDADPADHNCDICGKEAISECTDTNNDSVCDICGANLCDHSNKTPVEAVAATCEAAGNSKYYTCTCGQFLAEDGVTPIAEGSWVISKLGHDENGEWQDDGTNHYKICGKCNTKINVEAHSGGTATCVAKKVCTTCNKEYGETDTTDGHSFSTDWTTDGTNHWKVCQNGCGAKGYEDEHDGGTANCQDQAVCSTCQTPYGKTDSNNHKSVKTDAAVAATCEAAGLTEGSHCEACNTTITAQKEVPALGHEEGAAATCTTAQTCTRCSHVFTEALGHSYTNYVSNNDAKCEVDGTKTAKCDRCDETSTIPDEGSKLGHSYTQYVSNNNATCQTNATETASCDNGCGGKDTRPIADSMVDHSYGEYTSDNNAACLKDGTKTAKCIWCENTDTVTDTGSALRHSFTNYVSDGNATCMTDGTKTAKCDNNCGETSTITDAGSALGHSFTNYVPDRNETCADEGTETAKCDRCDAADTRDATGVQLKPHTFTNYVYNNDATCFADGTKTAHCDVCNTATDEIIAEGTQLTHSYSNYVSNKDATCTQDGTKSALCDHNCGTKDTIADTGSMLGHSFTKFESNGDASCTANGTETAKCDRCEEKMTQEDADSILPHSFTQYESNNDATCTADGTETAKCDNCDATHTRTQAGSMKDHEMGQWVEVTPAGCTTKGVERQDCENCDHFETKETDALGHNMGAWVTTTNPTCIIDGEERSDCDRCDHYETKVLKANGHDYHSEVTLEPTCVAKGTETYTCSKCQDTYTKELAETGVHTEATREENRVEATCGADGSYVLVTYCSVCDAVIKEEQKTIPATGAHTYEPSVTKEPTCIAVGEKTYTCSGCDASYTEEMAIVEHQVSDSYTTEDGKHFQACLTEGCSYKENEAVCSDAEGDGDHSCDVCEAPDVSGHTESEPVVENYVGATCTSAGSYDSVVRCAECNTELSRTSHSVSQSNHDFGAWEIITNATCTTDGSQKRACTVCGHEETGSIPATGHEVYNNGFCAVCDAYQPAIQNANGIYEIGNAGQLYWFAAQVDGDFENFGSANAILTDNITIPATKSQDATSKIPDWDPIGYYDSATYKYQVFSGTFDGNDKTISGLYVVNAAETFAGMFEQNNGTIRNLTLTDVSIISSATNVGGIAGYSSGSISGCSVSGSIKPDDDYDSTNYRGGIAGGNAGIIENCSCSATITGTSNYCGGIVASNRKTVTNCTFSGTVNGEDVGGIAADNQDYGIITDCINEGSVTGMYYAGGIVGNNVGIIENCRNSGSCVVTESTTNKPGAIAAAHYNIGRHGSLAAIRNCYNTADLPLVGTTRCSDLELEPVTIENCHNYSTSGFGIAGYASGTVITNCYYLAESETDSLEGTTFKTEAQFASGEVAYLLNGGSAEGVWKQTIGTDAYPTFAGATVYKNQTGGCTDATFTYAYSNTQEGDVIKHSWVEATCTEPMTCSACGATDGEKLGHSFTNYVPNNDATCTADGTKTAKCDRCGTATDTVVNEGSMLNHSFLNYVSDNNATCTKNGTETAKCKGCEATDTREDVDSMLDHAFTVEQSRTPATCKEEGSITWKCVSCDATTVETLAIDPSNHVEIKYEDAKAPSCTESGYEAYEYCTECDYTTRKEVAHLGHKPGAATEVNRVESSCSVAGSYESVVSCSVCGTEISRETVKLPLAEHSWEDATYDAPKMCGKCGATEGSKLQRPAVDMVAPETVVPSVPENAEIAKDAAEEAVNSLVSSANNVAQPVTGIESDGNVDSLGAAKQQIKDENQNVIAGSSYETSLIITLNAVVVDQEGSNVVAKKVTFDVSPMLYAINELGIKVGETKITAFDEPITFHLPVDKNSTAAFARVWHMDTEDLGLHKIQTDADGNRFVEVKAKQFSQFSLILEEECTDHNFVDGKCTICGEKEPRTLINLSGTAMTLGNSLSLDFGINIALLENNGEGHYAIITRHYADGTQDDVVRVDRADWQPYNGTVLTASYKKLAAKEMCDVLEVVVYNAAGEVISNTYTDSIRNYAIRQLNNSYNQSNTELLTVLVDMLNYGAAAQQFFRYNESNLANMDLNDVQKAYATDDFQAQDSRIKGNGYAGTALTLKNEILLDFVFFDSVIGTNYDGMYAIATYTNHYGEKKTVCMEEFKHYGAGYHYVSVNGMSVADCRQLVTCTVYNSNGEVIASATDSAEGYIARQIANGQTAEIYTSIMKFTISSYNYFH